MTQSRYAQFELLTILLIPICVSVASLIEPGACLALAIMTRCKKSIDQPFVCIGVLIILECFDLSRRRRQTNQVEADAANQGSTVSLCRRAQTLTFQAGQHKAINRVPSPVHFPHRRCRNTRWEGIRPVPRPRCPLCNPPAQQFNLPGNRPFLEFRWRHPLIGIIGRDPRDQLTLLDLSGYDHRIARAVAKCILLAIQPQVSLPCLRVRPVARVTEFRENRSDLAIEVDTTFSPCGMTAPGGE